MGKGKVIILAGAPDAAVLDWTAMPAEEACGRVGESRPWQHDEDSTHSPSQWRSVLRRDTPEAPVEPSDSIITNMDANGGEDDDDGDVEDYGSMQEQEWTDQDGWERAEFAEFAASDYSQSQSQSQTQRHHDWSVSSADITSLSFRLPNALPRPPPSPSQQSLPLSARTTASQELIEHSLAVHNALPSSLPEPSGFVGDAARGGSQDGRRRQQQHGRPLGDDNEPQRLPQRLSQRLSQRKQMLHYQPASFDTQSTEGSDGSLSFAAATSTSFDASMDASVDASVDAGMAATPPPLPPALPPWQPLTHLADIPSARVLASRSGRTVTVNLAVAVVAATAPRAVSVRPDTHGRPASSASLVELVVGDDTRSGFGITVWLDASAAPSPVARLLPTLQPQDIVLVRNLALNVFNGKVYGSTLRHNQTQMHMLWRHRHRRSSGDDSLFAAAHLAAAEAVVAQSEVAERGWRLAAKTARVREWALQYVVAADERRGADGPTAAGNIWMHPPADTQ